MKAVRRFVAAGFVVSGLLVGATVAEMEPVPSSLGAADRNAARCRLLDRRGSPLMTTFSGEPASWELRRVPELPELLVRAVVESEDRRFYEHGAVDWSARAAAMVSNIRAGRIVRGASTISEQVASLIHPRRAGWWTRWLEGFEASILEHRFSKREILEYYLNHVPYARRRTGIVQASRMYFGREPNLLTKKETLALVTLIRAPSRNDLIKDTSRIEAPIRRLAKLLESRGVLSPEEVAEVFEERLALQPEDPLIEAPHFIAAMERESIACPSGRTATTLDGELQTAVAKLLERRIGDLRERGVSDGAVLVVDYRTGAIAAWVNAANDAPTGAIDMILSPRQPGSALKPFLYELALERGWTASTIVEDAPLSMAVGVGLHSFKNYSRTFYGPLRVRDALANSLNTPAIRAAEFVSASGLLERLRNLGFTSLNRPVDFYGDGLALGNGEVTLYELVRAYATLARGGEFLEPYGLPETFRVPRKAILDRFAASIIADILSDPHARRLEFGSGHLLRFPLKTAVKTGTSTDFRDAWAVGFSGRYVVGIWFGNADRKPMNEVSGAVGPALLLRSVFSEIGKRLGDESIEAASPLDNVPVCSVTGLRAGRSCPSIEERFIPGTAPAAACDGSHSDAASGGLVRDGIIELPSPDLRLARDPRIPDDRELFPLQVRGTAEFERVDWYVDGGFVGSERRDHRKVLWKLEQGTHTARAELLPAEDDAPRMVEEVRFHVR